MPRSVHQLKLFVASPGDVQAERVRLEKVVREVNLSLSYARHPVQFELVRWETHVYPSLGSDPQAVINEQIGTDYDIFIGILWARFGTPTPRFPSGTLEEFEAAYQRWKADRNSITVMLYFKEEPLAPSQLDPNQLAQIQKFRTKFSGSGLYWTFKTVDDFETDVRLHLTRVAQDWRIRLNSTAGQNDNTTSANSTLILSSASVHDECGGIQSDIDETEDLGYFDYLELAANTSAQINALVARMSSASNLLVEKTRRRTQETPPEHSNPSSIRLVFEEGARDIRDFSVSLLSEISMFSRLQADLLKYVVGAATLALDLGPAGQQHVRQSLAAMDSSLNSLRQLRAALGGGRAFIGRFPRMTLTINKAKRMALQALETLDSTLADMVRRGEQVRSEIEGLVDRADKVQSSPD